MASEPIREQLLAKVRDRLAAIAAGATYWFTPGEVARDYKHYEECQDLAKDKPFYGVIEGDETKSGFTYPNIQAELKVVIVGWVVDEAARRIAVNRAIGDVLRACFSDEKWDALALETKDAVTIRTDEATWAAKPYAYFEVELTIVYVHARTAV